VTTQTVPFLDRVPAWTRAHKRATTWVGSVLVIGAVLFVWNVSSTRRSEVIAGRQLQGARYAFENQNLPLAASELSRVVENYSGTNAAAEARLLLGQVRLLQGQPAQAVELLRDFAPAQAPPSGRRRTGCSAPPTRTRGGRGRPLRPIRRGRSGPRWTF